MQTPNGCTARVTPRLKIMSSLCANVTPKEEPEIDKVLAGIPDPVGTFYRYGLAKSIDATAGESAG